VVIVLQLWLTFITTMATTCYDLWLLLALVLFLNTIPLIVNINLVIASSMLIRNPITSVYDVYSSDN